MTELTPEQEQNILRAIPNPKDLEELLEDEDTEKNGEARKVALLLINHRVTGFLIKNKERILGGSSVSFELEAEKVGKDYNIKPPHPNFLQEIADEIQRILEEKTYTVSCETKGGNLREIIVQRAPPLK